MARGDAISQTVPSVGDAETAASGDASAILQELKTRSESKVTPAEINVDATFDMNTQSVDNINDAEFINRGSAPASTTHRMYKTGNEWYLDGIQVTTGGSASLNVAAASGAIGGDYGTGDEILRYNSLAVAYEMLSDESPSKLYAGTDTGDIRLFEKGAAVVNAVTLKSPAALASSYDVTLPTALPSAQRYLTLDNSGVLTTTQNGLSYAEIRRVQQTGGFSGSSFAWANGTISNSNGANGTLSIPISTVEGEVLENFYYSIFAPYTGVGSTTVNFARVDAGGTKTTIATQVVPGVGNQTLSLGSVALVANASYLVEFVLTSFVSTGNFNLSTVALGVSRAI